MVRGLLFVTIAFLAAGSLSVCLAQDSATGDSNNLTREEWQSRVNATRERLEQRRKEMKREREERLAPKREELRLDREKRIEPKQEELRLDRERRLGPKQEELRRDREGRVDPKREELKLERDKQQNIR
jgi:hypothetical protein